MPRITDKQAGRLTKTNIASMRPGLNAPDNYGWRYVVAQNPHLLQ